MEIEVRHLTNNAYGFPTRGAARRVAPVALACIHITANPNTARNPNLHEAALDERNYANRAGSTGPSAHYYVARDGWAVEAVDPVRFAAWSNGDVKDPNTANPGIQAVLALRASMPDGNANEGYVLEIENVGYRPGYPITEAQKQACAGLIARESKRTGLPINRTTVHGHWEINGVDRVGCPSTAANHESFLYDIVNRANALTPYTQAELDAARAEGFEAGVASITAANAAALTAAFNEGVTAAAAAALTAKR